MFDRKKNNIHFWRLYIFSMLTSSNLRDSTIHISLVEESTSNIRKEPAIEQEHQGIKQEGKIYSNVVMSARWSLFSLLHVL